MSLQANYSRHDSPQAHGQPSGVHVSKIMPELWSLLTDMERESLMMWSRIERIEKDEVIFDATSSPMNIYVLHEGQVKLTQTRERTQIVQLVSPSDYFGHVPFLSGVDGGLSAVAMEASIVCSYPIHCLETLLNSNAEACYFFLKELSSRLWRHYRLLMSLTQKHLRGRLADAVLLLRDTFGVEEDGCTLKAKLSRGDLSELCNMNRGNVTRTLREIEQEGAVALNGREIIIRDLELLQEISKLG